MCFTTTVSRLIELYGSTNYVLNTVTLAGDIDEEYPTKGPVRTVVDYALKSYVTPVNSQKTATIALDEDIKLYIDPTDLDVIPTTNDTVTHATDGVYNITKVNTYKKVDTTVLYLLQIRR